MVVGLSMVSMSSMVVGHLWPWGIYGGGAYFDIGHLWPWGIYGCGASMVVVHPWLLGIYGQGRYL